MPPNRPEPPHFRGGTDAFRIKRNFLIFFWVDECLSANLLKSHEASMVPYRQFESYLGRQLTL